MKLLEASRCLKWQHGPQTTRRQATPRDRGHAVCTHSRSTRHWPQSTQRGRAFGVERRRGEFFSLPSLGRNSGRWLFSDGDEGDPVCYNGFVSWRPSRAALPGAAAGGGAAQEGALVVKPVSADLSPKHRMVAFRSAKECVLRGAEGDNTPRMSASFAERL